MRYLCPVCGFNELAEPPTKFNICPCCYTEFSNDDYGVSHERLRALWMNAGMQWMSKWDTPPVGWNPIEQLSRAGFDQLTRKPIVSISVLTVITSSDIKRNSVSFKAHKMSQLAFTWQPVLTYA